MPFDAGWLIKVADVIPPINDISTNGIPGQTDYLNQLIADLPMLTLIMQNRNIKQLELRRGYSGRLN
jgi:hypothetical protein